MLTAKKNLILIQMNQSIGRGKSLISCDGGVLMQEEDQELVTTWQVVTAAQPTQEDLEELEFAFKVCKYVKSNAIVVSSERAARGIGGGFVNRIDAAEYALAHAKGAAYLASDAFFPFPDVVQAAASHGIRCIIAPGGSTNDQASIDACDAAGIAMVFTGMRHFRH